MEKKRLIVIGGGFAGAYIAKKLEKEFKTTLIDTKDYFEFTPSVLRTIVEPSHAKNIRELHENYLQEARFVRGYVEKMDQEKVVVERKAYPYDFLVIAAGLRYHLPFRHDNIVSADRARELRNHYDALREAKSVVIIGGGLVGVELTAEIIYKYPGKKVTIIHSRPQLIPRAPGKVRCYVEKLFLKKGVRLVLGERMKKNDGKKCTTEKGTCVDGDLIFLCTGNKSSTGFLRESFPKAIDEKEKLKVGRDFALEGYTNIFVAGDIANVNEEKLAQNAEKHGEVVVQNIRLATRGDPLNLYNPQPRAMLISLGKKNGLFVWKGLHIRGRIPAMMKSYVERKTMKRYRR